MVGAGLRASFCSERGGCAHDRRQCRPAGADRRGRRTAVLAGSDRYAGRLAIVQTDLFLGQSSSRWSLECDANGSKAMSELLIAIWSAAMISRVKEKGRAARTGGPSQGGSAQVGR